MKQMPMRRAFISWAYNVFRKEGDDDDELSDRIFMARKIETVERSLEDVKTLLLSLGGDRVDRASGNMRILAELQGNHASPVTAAPRSAQDSEAREKLQIIRARIKAAASPPHEKQLHTTSMRKSPATTSHEHREAVTSLSSRPQIVGRLKAPIGPDSFHADSACRFGEKKGGTKLAGGDPILRLACLSCHAVSVRLLLSCFFPCSLSPALFRSLCTVSFFVVAVGPCPS